MSHCFSPRLEHVTLAVPLDFEEREFNTSARFRLTAVVGTVLVFVGEYS